jgi:hypothetical protein
MVTWFSESPLADAAGDVLGNGPRNDKGSLLLDPVISRDVWDCVYLFLDG